MQDELTDAISNVLNGADELADAVTDVLSG
jgi:hypothetical protein